MIRSSKLLNRILVLFTLCGLAVFAQSCDEAPKEEEQAVSEFNLTTAKAEIEEANKNFMALVAAGDSVGLANSFTVDAKLMAPGGPAVEGRSNIQTAISGILQSGITAIDLRTINVYGTEDLIAEEGEHTLFVGDQAVGEDKYIVLWKKEDGRWKLFRDIFNSNLPAE